MAALQTDEKPECESTTVDYESPLMDFLRFKAFHVLNGNNLRAEVIVSTYCLHCNVYMLRNSLYSRGIHANKKFFKTFFIVIQVKGKLSTVSMNLVLRKLTSLLAFYLHHSHLSRQCFN